MHDADQSLAGGEALQHVLAERLFFDPADKFAYDRQRDVGFEQRDANLAQHGVGVGFGQSCFALDSLYDAGQPLGQSVEHER